MVCEYCANIIPDDAVFCPECGKKIQNKVYVQYCTQCGFKLRSDNRFCPNCGEKIFDDSKATTDSIKEAINEHIEEKKDNFSEIKEETVKDTVNNFADVTPVVYAETADGSIDMKSSDAETISGDSMHTTSNEQDTYENTLLNLAEMEKKGDLVAKAIAAILCISIFVTNWEKKDFGDILGNCIVVTFIVLAVYGVIAALMRFHGAQRYLDKYRTLKKEIGRTEAIKVIEAQFHPENGMNLMKGGCLTVAIGFVVILLILILAMAVL